MASLPVRVDQEIGAPPGTLHGTLVNLSAGGASIVADRFIERLPVLPFKFLLSKVPVPVPVRAQVRWVSPSVSAKQETFRLGLLFIY